MKKITINTIQEFKEKVESKDIETITEIYRAIKRGIQKNNKIVTVFEVTIVEDSYSLYKFRIEKKHYNTSLKACMNIFADNDMFEECIEIQSLLKQLEEQDLVDNISSN